MLNSKNSKKKLLIILIFFILSLIFVIFTNIKNTEAQTFKEIVYEGRTYLTYNNLNNKDFEIKFMVAREASKRGLPYGYWTGCGFVFSDVGKRYVLDQVRSTPGDVCKNLSGVQTTLPANHRFKVGDEGYCELIDKCLNMYGVQPTVPSGFVSVGGRMCQLANIFSVFCRPNINPARTNEEVFFIAAPINQEEGNVNFTFTNTRTGKDIGLGALKSARNERVSFSTGGISFSTEGIHQVTVTATDSSRNSVSAVCGITISNTLALDIDGDGKTDAVRSSIGSLSNSPAKVSLEGGGLTNNQCTIKWSSENVNECYFMTLNKGVNTKKIDFTGEGFVSAGKYMLRCFAYELSNVTQVVDSEVVTCLDNPDNREI